MKNVNRKSIVLLICVTLLLTFTVSGTVAYLVDASGPVENVFTPANVKTDIEESFDGNTKSSIKIVNQGTVAVYVRVAVIGNWVNDAGKVVAPWTGTFDLGSGWIKGTDGYYYHQAPVAANGKTSELLGSSITEADALEGTHLVITVIHQSIQAEPISTVKSEWDVTTTPVTDENDNILYYTISK